jgi:transaldolase
VTEASVLEKLQQANGRCEIWWDSSPASFPAWREAQLRKAPDAQVRRRWSAQLERFMVLEDPGRSLVRGITTNPSLIAKSILDAPDLWARRVRDLTQLESDPNVEGICWLIYLEAVRQAAQSMLPM